MQWRVGRKVGRTIYRDEGEGQLIGMMDTVEDARLAAAAPVLLAALEEAERSLAECNHQSDDAYGHPSARLSAIAKALAAIAHARGKS